MNSAHPFVRPSVQCFLPRASRRVCSMIKTYIRHDAHVLRDQIHLVLAREPHLLGKPIRVEVIDRDVLLTGSVRSYFQKQVAQESLRGLAGVARIVNRLEVATV